MSVAKEEGLGGGGSELYGRVAGFMGFCPPEGVIFQAFFWYRFWVRKRCPKGRQRGSFWVTFSHF